MVKKVFERPLKGRMLAGVCLSFADYFNIDVTLARLLWVLLLIPGGIPGVTSYLICWLVIPSGK